MENIGPIDLLVNNAGVCDAHLLLEVAEEAIDQLAVIFKLSIAKMKAAKIGMHLYYICVLDRQP